MSRQRIGFLVAAFFLPVLVVLGWRMSGPEEFSVESTGTFGAPAQLAAAAASGSCEPGPALVDLGEATLMLGGSTTPVVPVSPICPFAYELTIVSGDRDHRAGYQTEQTEERFVVEFVDSSGATVVSSSSTDDLADAQTIAIKTETLTLTSDITGVRVRHAGPSGVINSVSAIGLTYVPASTDVDCDDSTTTVYFKGPRLLAGEQESGTIDAFQNCLCLHQYIVAVSQDVKHRAGYQTDQTNERWAVTARNADGDVLGETGMTADLPDDRWAAVDLLSMESDLESGQITFTATNTAPGGVNSIDPVAIVVAAH